MSVDLADAALDDEPRELPPFCSSNGHRLRSGHFPGITAGPVWVTNEIDRTAPPGLDSTSVSTETKLRRDDIGALSARIAKQVPWTLVKIAGGDVTIGR